MTHRVLRAAALLLLAALLPAPAHAQTTGATANAAAAAPPAAQADPDLQVVPAEPDFTLVTLPTTLRMPAGRFVFRMTHRFTLPIDSGGVGDFIENFFNFDSAARVGFELRYGIRPGTQATVHRTNDRAIQFLGQHEILAPDDRRLFALHGLLAIEGQDNFSENFAGSLAGLISYRFGERGAVYAQPTAVFNANLLEVEESANNHTLFVGLGARVRLGETRVYLVGEVAPRLAGFDAGVDHVSFGIEKRAGGHVFQLNVSNGIGTTLAQVARGGPPTDSWFIGFNLTRRFF